MKIFFITTNIKGKDIMALLVDMLQKINAVQESFCKS